MQHVLNEPLYDALTKLFGQGSISKSGDSGSFEFPEDVKTRKEPYVRVHDWGETYSFDCPACKDNNQKLAFGHRWGTCTTKTEKGRKRFLFGRHLYRCHRRSCDLWEWLKSIELPEEYGTTPLQGGEIVKLSKNAPMFGGKVDLPVPSHLLIESDVPAEVIEYVRNERKFDPQVLSDRWRVRYCPPGAEWIIGEGESVSVSQFYDHRLVIPIDVQGKRFAWQARHIPMPDDGPKAGQPKYRFPSGIRKAAMLYNADQALFYPDVMLVEGVPSVWRIGEDAFAAFGKDVSDDQLDVIKILWRFDGRCVVCLDKDAWEHGQDKDVRLAAKLLAREAFPRGVACLRLSMGDPADYSERYMRQCKVLAQAYATTDPNSLYDAVFLSENLDDLLASGQDFDPPEPTEKPLVLEGN